MSVVITRFEKTSIYSTKHASPVSLDESIPALSLQQCIRLLWGKKNAIHIKPLLTTVERRLWRCTWNWYKLKQLRCYLRSWKTLTVYGTTWDLRIWWWYKKVGNNSQCCLPRCTIITPTYYVGEHINWTMEDVIGTATGTAWRMSLVRLLPSVTDYLDRAIHV